jgi:hypothetical protein
MLCVVKSQTKASPSDDTHSWLGLKLAPIATLLAGE